MAAKELTSKNHKILSITILQWTIGELILRLNFIWIVNVWKIINRHFGKIATQIGICEFGAQKHW